MPNTYFDFKSEKLDVVGIDADAGVIRGVSVIEGGVIAEGHNLLVDDVALKQFFSEAHRKVKVPVKVNHKSGFSEVAGYLCNPRLDGNHLRADWHLLQNNKDYDLILEAAEKMPECFGLSTAFRGTPEIVSGQPRARCELLKSVDVVVDPAANTTGLFQARVDSNLEATSTNMMTDFETLLSAIQDQGKTIKEFSSRIEGLEGNLTEFADALADAAEEVEAAEDDEIDINDLTDEELEALLDEVDEDDQEEQFSAEDDALSYLIAEVQSLKKQLADRDYAEQQYAEESAFSALQEKVIMMADELQRSTAENDALRQAITGAGVNVAFDTDTNGYALTSAKARKLHQFDQIVDARAADDKTQPRSAHFSALVAERPDLYADYREFMFGSN